MTNSQRLAKVRARLLRWLADEQAGTDSGSRGDDDIAEESLILSESILIRDEFYCGRRFHTATHNAIWFIEEDELKIYSSDRQLCAVLTSEEFDLEAGPANPRIHSAPEVHESAPAILKLPEVKDAGTASDDADNELRRAA